jgi:hypothetical protein
MRTLSGPDTKPQLKVGTYARLSETCDAAEPVPAQLVGQRANRRRPEPDTAPAGMAAPGQNYPCPAPEQGVQQR